jgi:2-polyprenyl-6-methoxyphenol hydroxylase-like FAD-dependent oxidoreductase
MPGKPRVLIVGAGIAGITLAASLERCGISPTVVEIANESLSRGLALALTSNVALALRRLGLDSSVIRRGIVLERAVQTDASGAPLAHHDFRPSNNRYAPNLGITRDGLISGLSGEARMRIRYSTTIVSAEWSAGGAVEVSLSDGTGAQFDLVVGADGIHSVVRNLIYPNIDPSYRSFCAWRTVMESSDDDPVLRIRSSPGYLLGSFQVGPSLIYAFLLAHHAVPPTLSRDERLERFKELAARFHGAVPSLIQRQRDPSRIVFVPVHEVHTPLYYQGRMLLIGDAAHAFPPNLAQGAAMAIEDAVALTELLDGCSDVDRVLRAYQARRRPRVETIRAAVRHRAITGGLEGTVTPELLKQHPPVFANSMQAFEDLIEDPFARDDPPDG